MAKKSKKQKEENNKEMLGVRLDADTLRQLEAVAEQEDRSLSYLGRLAIGEFLKRRREQGAAA